MTQTALEALGRLKHSAEIAASRTEVDVWFIHTTRDVDIIRRALKRVEALDKDLANGWVLVQRRDDIRLTISEGLRNIILTESLYNKIIDKMIAAAPESNVSKLGDE